MVFRKYFFACITLLFPLAGHAHMQPVNSEIVEFQNKFESLAKSEQWDEIITLGTIALDAAKMANRTADEAKICAQLTSTSFYQGNYTKALEYAVRCHELSEAFENPSLFLRALYLESAVYRALASKSSDENGQQSLYQKATTTAKKAADLFMERAIDNRNLKGKIYFNWGAAHADNPIGDLHQAEQCYSIALECFRGEGATDDVVRTYIRLGKVHLLQKDYTASQKIVADVRPLISSNRIAMHINYLEAQIQFALKEYTQAQHLAKEGLAIAELLGAKEDHARFSNLIQLIQESINIVIPAR